MSYTPNLTKYWNEIAERIEPEGRAFINGELYSSPRGEVFASKSPGSGRFLCNVEACDDTDIDIAVAGARESFNSGTWSRKSPQHRKEVLLNFASIISKQADELAVLETLDMGKPTLHSRQTDIEGSVQAIKYFAECIDKIYGSVAPNTTDGYGLIIREPVGVVAAITPWNFPFYMAVWKVGMALAMGNSVVVKPSERASLSTIRLGQLAFEAGIPAGVLQIVPGLGHEAGAALGRHMDIDCVSFTGSHKTAGSLMSLSGESNNKPVWIEAGGKSAAIVFEDADLEAAAGTIAAGCFYNQGEVCFASSRLLLPEILVESFVELVVESAEHWMPDNPLNERSNAGALVDQAHLDSVQGFVDRAIAEGAVLRLGGEPIYPDTEGFYYPPTILTNVRPDMEIAQEEVFGPVLAVMTYEDEDDAVRIANSTRYGLASALWTNDYNRIMRLSENLQSGMVWVNTYHQGDMALPFGGIKMSGNTRDKSLMGFEKYTQVKTVFIAKR